MKTVKNERESNNAGQKPVSNESRLILQDLYPLSGKQVLDQILKHERFREVIRELPSKDFFWLVKKVGEEDCLPLLEKCTAIAFPVAC